MSTKLPGITRQAAQALVFLGAVAVLLGLASPWAVIVAGPLVSAVLPLDVPVEAGTISPSLALGIAVSGSAGLVCATVAFTTPRRSMAVGIASTLVGSLGLACVLLTINAAQAATISSAWFGGIIDASSLVSMQVTAGPAVVVVGAAAVAVGGLLTIASSLVQNSVTDELATHA